MPTFFNNISNLTDSLQAKEKRLSSSEPVNGREKGEEKAPSQEGGASSGGITLSREGRLLDAVSQVSHPEEDIEKISRIRAAVEDGSYLDQIDNKQVATKMFDLDQLL